MRLYLIRHADPDYQHDTITAAGHDEAQALAERLAKEKLDRLYSSPLGRARATAEYTCLRLGMEYTIEEWTREIAEFSTQLPDGTQRMSWDIDGEAILGNPLLCDPLDWYNHPPFSEPLFAQGYQKIRASSDAFFSRHGYIREGSRYRVSDRSTERIAVFCHGGFGLTWLAHLLNIPVPVMWAGFWLPPTSVTTLVFDERNEGWSAPRCLGVGDVSHLYSASLPIRPRGILANFD